MNESAIKRYAKEIEIVFGVYKECTYKKNTYSLEF